MTLWKHGKISLNYPFLSGALILFITSFILIEMTFSNFVIIGSIYNVIICLGHSSLKLTRAAAPWV